MQLGIYTIIDIQKIDFDIGGHGVIYLSSKSLVARDHRTPFTVLLWETRIDDRLEGDWGSNFMTYEDIMT